MENEGAFIKENMENEEGNGEGRKSEKEVKMKNTKRKEKEIIKETRERKKE